MNSKVCYLPPYNVPFPPPSQAQTEPNGLLAMGGDLSPQRLLNAYKSGIFPWYSKDDPILWWSPDPRGILYLDQLRINRTLSKVIKRKPYTLSVNRSFDKVIQFCSKVPRKEGQGTWITEDIIQAYTQLHQLGHAHSIEVWQDDELVGGIYGIMVGGCFCAESMFHTQPNASKIAYWALVNWMKQHQAHFIDCQMQNNFLVTLGVCEIPRDLYLEMLAKAQSYQIPENMWQKQAIDFD